MAEFDKDLDTAQSLAALSERIGTWAEGKGFWEGEKAAVWLEEVLGPELVHLSDKLYSPPDNAGPKGIAVHRDMADRATEIAGLIRTLEFSSKIALVHSELSEMLETLRDNAAEGVLKGEGNFGEEGADTIIRVLDLMFHSNQPVGDQLMEKVKVNDGRPHQHGRKF